MQIPASTETFWSHLEIAGTILIPFIIYWITSRRDNERKHRENQDRLIAIETKIQPLWSWWNKTNGGGN